MQAACEIFSIIVLNKCFSLKFTREFKTGVIAILILANWGRVSYLPWSNTVIENGYQLLGFAGSALAVWLGLGRRWAGVVNLGSTFFVLYLYTKLFDWFWDWMPKYLFFLLLGLVAVLLLVVMRRFRARTGEASSPGHCWRHWRCWSWSISWCWRVWPGTDPVNPRRAWR